jgi:hypothetical protein
VPRRHIRRHIRRRIGGASGGVSGAHPARGGRSRRPGAMGGRWERAPPVVPAWSSAAHRRPRARSSVSLMRRPGVVGPAGHVGTPLMIGCAARALVVPPARAAQQRNDAYRRAQDARGRDNPHTPHPRTSPCDPAALPTRRSTRCSLGGG